MTVRPGAKPSSSVWLVVGSAAGVGAVGYLVWAYAELGVCGDDVPPAGSRGTCDALDALWPLFLLGPPALVLLGGVAARVLGRPAAFGAGAMLAALLAVAPAVVALISG